MVPGQNLGLLCNAGDHHLAHHLRIKSIKTYCNRRFYFTSCLISLAI